MGIVLGGVLVAKTGNYRLLFTIDDISFVVFFVVVYFAIQETNQVPKLISEGNSQIAFEIHRRAFLIQNPRIQNLKSKIG